MMHPDDVLHRLAAGPLLRLSDLPDDAVGLYALADHDHGLRYVGMTRAPAESFRRRIYQRHRTGSETHSHMFSRMYCTGRMWRDRVLQRGHPDGNLAKRLRNAFVAEHCRAAVVPVDPHVQSIPLLEREVLRRAPPAMVAWNGQATGALLEPVALVDGMIAALGLDAAERAVLDRQAALQGRHASIHA